MTRAFFSRTFRSEGRQRLRLGAGLHWLGLEATLAGQARVDETTTEFRWSSATADLPAPNLAALYRYSPSEAWLLPARIDWLSASIDKWSGDIWNASAGVNYRMFEHFGVGVNYQYVKISGTLPEANWQGSVSWTFSGTFLYMSGYW